VNDLQQLYRRSETKLVSPLEDFTTEALAIAIRHDGAPLLRMLSSVTDWRLGSGAPSIELSTVREVSAETQHYLYHEGLQGGRLDLVVELTATEGLKQSLWIEVKIDAPLTVRPERPRRRIS